MNLSSLEPFAPFETLRLYPREQKAALLKALGNRPIVLVGLMGCGKSSVGRRLAEFLGLPFVDSDAEIEIAAGMSISDIFAARGEEEFRQGERRVMERLLQGGRKVLATGGGTFIHEVTRSKIQEQGVSIWLKADFEVLMARVRRRPTRPLLANADPEKTMMDLMEKRYPVYAEAHYHVTSNEAPHEAVVARIIRLLEKALLQPDPLPYSSEELKVQLGDRSYPISIKPKLLDDVGPIIAERAPGARVAIITDENVAKLHLPHLTASLEQAGIGFIPLIIPPGESSKSYDQFVELAEAIIAAKLERKDLIIGFGGGVVGDLSGFVAASVRRGMGFVQIPTTLLAQVDSSIGGKTGINSAHGKNLIGAFYQPSLVIVDTDILTTLPPREFRAGYAEVVKYGLINDVEFFDWLGKNLTAIFNHGPELREAIAISCRAKARVVARDERESGERALLNLGHSFGHALEKLTQYDSTVLVHGEAVAIGMVLAFEFSVFLGICPAVESKRVRDHLARCGLPVALSHIPLFNADPSMILEAMYQDKKVDRGGLNLILAHRIGQSFVAKNCDPEKLLKFLKLQIIN